MPVELVKMGQENCLLPCLKVGDTASVCLSAMWHSKGFPAGRSVFVDPQHQCLKSPAYFQPGSAHFSAQTLKHHTLCLQGQKLQASEPETIPHTESSSTQTAKYSQHFSDDYEKLLRDSYRQFDCEAATTLWLRIGPEQAAACFALREGN